ncbi:MAG: ATP-binding protein [Candidatus Micrarchaeia archaeon]
MFKIQKFFDLKLKRNNGPAITLGSSISILEKSHFLTFQNQKYPSSDYHYVWKRMKKRIIIPINKEPNPHMVIAGMSGQGKSTLLKSMLHDIHRSDIPCIIFDSNNEHESVVKSIGGTVIDASTSGINLMELGGSPIGSRIDELTSLLSEVYGLGYLQATKLNSCLWYTYMHKGARSRQDSYLDEEPTINDLLEELSIFIRKAGTKQEYNTLRNMYQKLSGLRLSAFQQSSISIEATSKGISSLSLAGMQNDKAKLIYINELLRRLYKEMHSKSIEHGLSMYIILDESQLIMGNENGSAVIGDIIEEGRKFGFGTIIISHMASRLDKRIIANASIFMSFHAKEPGEINYVSSILSGAQPEMQASIKNKLYHLDKHEAILLSSTYKKPVLIMTKKLFASETHSDLRARMLQMLSEPMRYEKLCSILQAYSKVDIDNSIEGLSREGLLSSRSIDGDLWLMKHSNSISIDHEVNILKIKEKLDKCGISGYINRSYRGPDIVVGKVALEYETGLKNIKSTEKMLSNRGVYSKVIVIVDDLHFGEYSGIGNSYQYSNFMQLSCEALHSLLYNT